MNSRRLCVGLVFAVVFSIRNAAVGQSLPVEVALNLDSRLPVIDVEVFEENALLIVDTGASSTVLSRKYQPTIGALGRDTRLSTGGGSIRAKLYENRPIKIKGQTFFVEVLILPKDPDFRMLGLQIAGSLGADCTKDYVVQFDPDSNVLRILDSTPEAVEANVPYFRMSADRSRRFVEITLPSGSTERALIDTGTQYTLNLRGAVFDELIKAGTISGCYSDRTTTANGVVKSLHGTLTSLKIGSHEFCSLNVKRDTGSPDESAIGWAFLRRFIVTMDMTKNRLYLQPSKYYSLPEVRDKSGLQCYRDTDGLKIRRIIERSPAHRAELKGDDLIRSINGIDGASLTMAQIYEMLSKEGDEVQVVIERNGELMIMKFKLEEFRFSEEK